jgi:hypothetical protein
VPSRWLEALKEEEGKHNIAAALREGQNRLPIGPAEKPKTPINPTAKTAETPPRERRRNPSAPETLTAKTAKTTEAGRLGLIATWSIEFGYVSLHDPMTGEWYDLRVADAPGWALWEARKRKELYRDGNRRAYRLTSSEMEELWETEHPDTEFGIVEDYPVEGA